MKKNNEIPHILVIDDSPIILSLLEEGLSSNGYRVTACNSGQDALKLIVEVHDISLILLDYQLGDTNGLELMKHIKETEDIPFVVISDHFDDDIVLRAGKLGALSYIKKPLDLNAVLPVIHVSLIRAKHISNLTNDTELNKNLFVATGIIAERFHVDHNTAYELLRGRARKEQRKVRELATELVQETDSIINSGIQKWKV